MIFPHKRTQIISFKALKASCGFINLSGRKKKVSRRFSNPNHYLKEELRSIPQIKSNKAETTGTKNKKKKKQLKVGKIKK